MVGVGMLQSRIHVILAHMIRDHAHIGSKSRVLVLPPPLRLPLPSLCHDAPQNLDLIIEGQRCGLLTVLRFKGQAAVFVVFVVLVGSGSSLVRPGSCRRVLSC